MMRDDVLNSDSYLLRTEMTGTKQIPTLNICSAYKSGIKDILVDKTLFQICYTDKDESKGIIVDECFTEEDKS